MWIPWALAAVVFALAAVALAFIHFRETPQAKTVLRYTIPAPENTTNLHSFAISPDGRLLAIAATVNGKRQLWLRPMDGLRFIPMPGTDDATYPFWSPDSRYIGFFAEHKLKKIAASGGPAQSLCDADEGRGGSWNREGVIVFSPIPASALTAIQRVSAAGGVPADVTERKGSPRFPLFLPDGRHFLYLLIQASAEQNGVYLSSLDGKENRRVLPDASSSVVLAAGRLLFIRDNTLMAQPFDATSGRAVGEVFPVAEGALTTHLAYDAPVTVSETGVLLYDSGGLAGGSSQMAWYDRSGKLLGTVGAPARAANPAISPDGKAVAFQRLSASGADLWLRNVARGGEQRFTTDPSTNATPLWSPQGDRIVFSSSRIGKFNLYQKAGSGTGQDELLVESGNNKFPSQWSRDGRFVAYSERDPKTQWDVWVLPMQGDRKPVPFVRSEFNESLGQLSPDSHWMAYVSDESGRPEVYVRPLPAGEGQWKISIAGGGQPRWRGDGKELFFVGGDGKMTAVAVKVVAGTQRSFEVGSLQPLFEALLIESPANLVFQYDVTSDGKRFLLATTGGASASAPTLTAVVNWDAGLKK
jgi:Tol biopolymer transport system component